MKTVAAIGLAATLQAFVIGLLSMTSFPVATGEIVFHNRDHSDQGGYNPNQPVYNVRNYTDAMVS